MSRDIKFRGKRVNGGEWVHGDLWQPVRDNQKIAFIFRQDNKYEVVPATVGQFTGRKDKNGVEVYEGDKIGAGDDALSVFWNEQVAGWGTYCYGRGFAGLCDLNSGIEVIGNIHTEEQK